MVDNFDNYLNFLKRRVNDWYQSAIAVYYSARKKDTGCKSLVMRTDYFVSPLLLDKESIISFCDKYQCRAYIHFINNPTGADIARLDNLLFHSLYVDVVTKESFEEYRSLVGDDKVDFRKIDVDNLMQLENIKFWLTQRGVEWFEEIPSKTGLSLIFESRNSVIEQYLDSPLAEESHIFNGASANLYIPDFKIEKVA